MHRPSRIVAAIALAIAATLVPTLALGATGSAPPPDPSTSDTAPGSDASGRDQAPADPVSTVVPQPDGTTVVDVRPGVVDVRPDDRPDVRPDEQIRLACEPAVHLDQRGIACTWSDATSDRAAGYRLWRAVDVPNPEGHRHVIARGGLDFTSHVDTDLAGHTFHYAVEVVDAGGRTIGWSPTVKVDLVRDEHLRLGCHAVDSDRAVGIACEWSPSHHPHFAAYRLVRTDGDRRTTVFETREQRTTRFFDELVRRQVRYTYVVQVLDRHGHVVGSSGPSTAGLPGIPDERLDLACELTSDGDQRGVLCKWSEASHPEAAGYVLYRSVDGGAREAIHRTGLDGRRHHFDTAIRPGNRLRYAVVLVNGAGEAIGQGGPVVVEVPAPESAPDVSDRPTTQPTR